MARHFRVVAVAAIGLTACGATDAASDSSDTGETLAPVIAASPVTTAVPTTAVPAPVGSTTTASPTTAAPTAQVPTPTRRIEIDNGHTLVVPLLGEISPEPRLQTDQPRADHVLAAEYWRSDDLYLVSGVVQNVVPKYPDSYFRDVINVGGVEWSIFVKEESISNAVTSVAVVDGIAYSVGVSELGPDRDFLGPPVDFLIDTLENTSIER